MKNRFFPLFIDLVCALVVLAAFCVLILAEVEVLPPMFGLYGLGAFAGAGVLLTINLMVGHKLVKFGITALLGTIAFCLGYPFIVPVPVVYDFLRDTITFAIGKYIIAGVSGLFVISFIISLFSLLKRGR